MVSGCRKVLSYALATAFCMSPKLASCTTSSLPYIGQNHTKTTTLTSGLMDVQPKRRHLKRIRVIGPDPPPWRLPLGHCVGDCDRDSDCEAGLVCFQKDRFATVPGCSGGDRDGSLSDYCVYPGDVVVLQQQQQVVSWTPQDSLVKQTTTGGQDDDQQYPWIQIVGNNIFAQTPGALQLCQGDCDSHRDCAGDLICFQRQRYQPVFGCRGGSRDGSQQDYCIDRDAVLPPSERSQPFPVPYTTSRPVRLKLYWQEGYRWQEESREREWCMMHNYYRSSSSCWHGLRSQTCDPDAVYISQCRDNEPRQEFVFLRLRDSAGTGNDEEVLIRLGSDHIGCLERRGNAIVLEKCNERNPLQRWIALNGNLNGYRFELSQTNYKNQCITQAHHPKEGEVVELHSCSASRDHKTSYWNVY